MCGHPALQICSWLYWAIGPERHKERLDEYSSKCSDWDGCRITGSCATSYLGNPAYVLVSAPRVVGEPLYLSRAPGYCWVIPAGFSDYYDSSPRQDASRDGTRSDAAASSGGTPLRHSSWSDDGQRHAGWGILLPGCALR